MLCPIFVCILWKNFLIFLKCKFEIYLRVLASELKVRYDLINVTPSLSNSDRKKLLCQSSTLGSSKLTYPERKMSFQHICLFCQGWIVLFSRNSLCRGKTKVKVLGIQWQSNQFEYKLRAFLAKTIKMTPFHPCCGGRCPCNFVNKFFIG